MTDLEQHLFDEHGVSVLYLRHPSHRAWDWDEYHQRMHADETARHLGHLHVTDAEGNERTVTFVGNKTCVCGDRWDRHSANGRLCEDCDRCGGFRPADSLDT